MKSTTTFNESRRYTVQEIDDLRRACCERWLYGTTNISSGRFSRQYQQHDKDKGVEELVRTCMMAGITAIDIYDKDNN